jgi:hypothetical protein
MLSNKLIAFIETIIMKEVAMRFKNNDGNVLMESKADYYYKQKWPKTN